MNKIKLIIKNDMYPFKFYIFINYIDKDEIKKLVKYKKGYEAHKQTIEEQINGANLTTCTAITFYHETILGVILPPTKDKIERFDSLNHELFHLVSKAGKTIGLVQSEDSEEFYAYLQGWLTKKIYPKIC